MFAGAPCRTSDLEKARNGIEIQGTRGVRKEGENERRVQRRKSERRHKTQNERGGMKGGRRQEEQTSGKRRKEECKGGNQ